MDIEVLVKKIEDLENQITSLKKALSQQTTSINDVNEKTIAYQEKFREQNAEITRLKNQIGEMGQFNAAISKLRIDVNKQIGESEKRVAESVNIKEKLRDDEVKNIHQKIDVINKDTSLDLDRKLKEFLEEDARLVQRIKETEDRVEQKLTDNEDIKGMLGLLQQEVKQNRKLIDNVNSEFDAYKNRMDDTRSKLDTVSSEIRKSDNRMNEIIAMESERSTTFDTFMATQMAAEKNRESLWIEWKKQFEISTNKINELLPELQKLQVEINKTKSEFDEIAPKFDRRANELTEMYRIMDDKFRKEWATYRTDLEKRWANVTLSLDDRQGGLVDQIEKVRDRMQSVEDRTHDIQEALLLMSREIQKGMHGIMNMVNGWMDAFSLIEPKK